MEKEQLDAMARRIKQRRKAFGLTQEQAAERLDISYSSYTKIENGFQNPSIDTLISLSVSLHLSLDEMVFGHDESADGDTPGMRAITAILKSCDKDKLAYAVGTLEKIVSRL